MQRNLTLPQFLATLGAFRFAENGENYQALSCRVDVSVGLLSFHALNVTWVGILCKCATTYFAGTAADAPNARRITRILAIPPASADTFSERRFTRLIAIRGRGCGQQLTVAAPLRGSLSPTRFRVAAESMHTHVRVI